MEALFNPDFESRPSLDNDRYHDEDDDVNRSDVRPKDTTA